MIVVHNMLVFLSNKIENTVVYREKRITFVYNMFI